MTEYRYSRVVIIFAYVLALAVFLGFPTLLLWPFIGTSDDPPSMQYWAIVIPAGIALCILMVFVVKDARDGKIILHDDGIIQVSVWKKKAMRAADIKGYRLDEHYTRVFSHDGKQIKISQYYVSRHEIQDWVMQFPDLDLFDMEAEEDAMLNNADFGPNPEARKNRVKNAKLACRILNSMGVITTVWILFWPKPYNLVICVTVLVVIASFAMLVIFKGIIKLDERKGSAHPSLIYAIGLTSGSLAIRAAFDMSILSYKPFWMVAIPFVLILLVFFARTTGELKVKKATDLLTIFSVVLVLVIFAYGSITTLNAILDNNEPQVFEARILSKRIAKGKMKTYHVTLEPWGPKTEAGEVTVPATVFENVQVNTLAKVWLHPGAIGIPWYVVTPCY